MELSFPFLREQMPLYRWSRHWRRSLLPQRLPNGTLPLYGYAVSLQLADAYAAPYPDDDRAEMEALAYAASWERLRAVNSLVIGDDAGAGDAMHLFDVCPLPDRSPSCDLTYRASYSS